MQTVPHNLILNLLVQEHVPYLTRPTNVPPKSIKAVFNWLAYDKKNSSPLETSKCTLQHQIFCYENDQKL